MCSSDLVLAMNDIVDPLSDWPLDYRTFIKFVTDKYSANASAGQTGLEWAASNTYGYYKVVTKTNPDIGMTDTNKFKIDANTYNDLVETDNSYVLEDGSNLRIVVTKETKSYYEYEQELNENKRLISILKPEFVSEIEAELISIMKDTVA